MPIILNGRELAANLLTELKNKITQLSITPKLGVILVGNDQASHLYVSLKEQAAKKAGIDVEKILLPESITEPQLIDKIKIFNDRPDIHGILIQLPLPSHINEHEVILSMNSEKDADGFHPQNLADLENNQATITPGATAGIIKLIELSGQPITNKQAYLIVNSDEFAQPLKKLLQDKGALISVSRLPEPNKLKQADIVIVALGKPNIIKSEFIKDGAILIDVGTTKINGKIVGDIEALGFANRQVYLTPVPGGVGPMTVVMLLWNVYSLARRAAEKAV